MAIFHLHIKHIGKSGGNNAISASAYRSGSKMAEISPDGDLVKWHNFQNKRGVVFSKIFAPEDTSIWMRDREALWNMVQNHFDIRVNSVYAQEIDIALPVELSHEENKALLTEYVEDILVREGIIADVNIHMDNPDNPHAHLMLSTREVVKDAGGDFTFGKKVRYWDKRDFLIHLRKSWADYVNKHLQLKGLDMRISHLSNKERKIGLAPSVKEGIGRILEDSDRQRANIDLKNENARKVRDNPDIIIDVLSNKRSLFTRQDIEYEIGRYFTDGNLEIVSLVLESDRLQLAGMRDLEGRILYKDRLRSNLEKAFLDLLGYIRDNSNNDHNLEIGEEDIQYSSIYSQIAKKVGLSKHNAELSMEQRRAVIDLVNSGSISVLEGAPGSGKTTIIGEVAKIYRREGRKIIASAVSSNAANILGISIGSKAYNTTKLRYEIERGLDFRLDVPLDWKEDGMGGEIIDSNTILIIDEASMIDLAEMHYFLSKISKVGAKMILIGDRNQLPSIRLAGSFHQITKFFPPIYLGEVKRHEIDLHKEATRKIAISDIETALEIYKSQSNLIFKSGKRMAIESLVQEYVKAYLTDSGSRIQALAYRREDVSILNKMIRENLKLSGSIAGKGKFAIGDRIVFTRNDKKLGIVNNDMGEIVDYIGSKLKIRLDRQREILSTKIPLEIIIDQNVHTNLEHAYAITITKAQGSTYDYVFALVDKSVNYNIFNVISTRHKKDFKLFINDEIIYTNKEEIEESWHFRKKSLLPILSEKEEYFFEEDFKETKDTEILADYLEAKYLASKLASSGNYKRRDMIKVLNQRKNLANHIYNHLEEYKHHLAMLGISQKLLLKHAGRYQNIESKRASSHFSLSSYREISSLLEDLGNLQQVPSKPFFKGQRQEIISRILGNLERVRQEISSVENKICELEFDFSQKLNIKHQEDRKISSIRNYIEVQLPYFLGTIFKEESKEILENWIGILSESKDFDSAYSKINKNLAILGTQRGRGIGRLIAFDKSRDKSNTNLKLLGKRLAQYEEYKKEISVLESESDWQKELFYLRSDIRRHKSFLLPKAARELIEEIDELRINEDAESLFNSLRRYLSKNLYSKPLLKSAIFRTNSSIADFESIFRQYAHAINPDGKIVINGAQISCGSLTMNLKNGLWYRFSTSEGGNIQKFLEKSTGHLAAGNEVPISAKHEPRRNIKDWVQFDSIPTNAPELNPHIHIPYLTKGGKIEAIYDYKNLAGNLIGHTIRIKDGDSKKVLPVSYCHLGKKEGWRVKGFSAPDSSKPIYGLEKIRDNNNPILIVEGEKTADAAQKLLKEYNVISWLGGSSSADKVNWSVLKGKEIYIWPDNDRIGIQTARVIMRKLGGLNNSLKHVYCVNIRKWGLPEKWDLADDLPESLKDKNVAEILSETKDIASIVTEKNFATERERRIYWRNKYSGMHLTEPEVSEIALREERYYSIFDSHSCRDYSDYMGKSGDLETSHEFLEIKHELYKDILTSIAVKEKFDMKDSHYIILDLAEEKFSEKIANFVDHLPYTEKYQSQLKGRNALYTTILRDIFLLQKMQDAPLFAQDRDLLAKNLAEIIVKEDRFDTDHDKIRIANKSYIELCSSGFYKARIDREFQEHSQEISRNSKSLCLEL